MTNDTVEHRRLAASRDGTAAWKHWGPYLSERAWGTVREDYSANGTAWDYFPHDHARSRAYRWGEDGIAGISDDQQLLCFALALWNGQDLILKERIFGLTSPEGNHGEDVKEYYYYLDNTPTHSFMRMLYKYPQRAFPYHDLVETNRNRGKGEREYELIDTGVFAEDRYFDVAVAYAKAGPDDLLVRITATNRGPNAAELHLLPTLWFRNTWSWGGADASEMRPLLECADNGHDTPQIRATHPALGDYLLSCDRVENELPLTEPADRPALLFTGNETNLTRLYGVPNTASHVKDGINDAVVDGNADTVNPDATGTKAAAHYALTVAPGATATVRLRLTKATADATTEKATTAPFTDFDALFALREAEADAFYRELQPPTLDNDARAVQRQAFAGMLWSKQFYGFDVGVWLNGDPGQPAPPPERRNGRNREWMHFNSADIISMPDKWEYPWFAAWDLAFHCVPLALLDPDFAKAQLILLGEVWYQHPNGQIPAYEWAYGDVNPPVLAWAAWRVYKTEEQQHGVGDLGFLERVFHKQMLNFTWWVNRKDAAGMNVFQGGFLGLDNIGVFDRSAPLPTGGRIEQSDGTSWMGMFSLNMLNIAIELACQNPVYEDIATKFFEHFMYIAAAMNDIGGKGIALWDDEDEFFYDVLHIGGKEMQRLKIRSMVGLIPLYAVAVIEPARIAKLPNFQFRLEWFLANRPELAKLVSRWKDEGMGERHLLAILRGHRMKRVLRRMLDPQRFLSPYGVRALSRDHLAHPFIFESDGTRYVVEYQPAESHSGLFGGNSNWRGPVWFPVNYLIIESLREFHRYYGDDFTVEYPSNSGQYHTIAEIAVALSQRLIGIFLRDDAGRRAVFGDQQTFQSDPHWRDYIPFHEYFNGDTGEGIGASHQTGWTGLVAALIQEGSEGPSAKDSPMSQ